MSKKLEDIIKEGEDLAEIENPPTLVVMKELNNIVEEFLKKKSLVIYGGTAIKVLLKQKDIQISSPDLLIDYDFFSPRYDEDSKELADKIYEKNYKYVRRINAIHPNTFRVGAEFAKQFIADITYFPEEYFGILQANSPKIDGLHYTDPQFLKIDLYLSVTRPNYNVFRWSKSYKRLYYIEEKYPLQIIKESNIKKKSATFSKTLKKIKDIISGIKIIFVGISAYIYYMEIVSKGKTKSISEDYIELYTMEPKKVIKEIQDNFPKVTIKEIPKFVDILPARTEIYIKDELYIIIYDIGFDCISYHKDFANYFFLLWYLYAFRYIEGIFKKNNEILCKYTNMIINLQNAESEYNISNNTNLLNTENPFRIFDTKCLSVDPKAFMLQAPIRMFHGIHQAPGYRPDKILKK